jgi:hypothetical protein
VSRPSSSPTTWASPSLDARRSAAKHRSTRESTFSRFSVQWLKPRPVPTLPNRAILQWGRDSPGLPQESESRNGDRRREQGRPTRYRGTPRTQHGPGSFQSIAIAHGLEVERSERQWRRWRWRRCRMLEGYGHVLVKCWVLAQGWVLSRLGVCVYLQIHPCNGDRASASVQRQRQRGAPYLERRHVS